MLNLLMHFFLVPCILSSSNCARRNAFSSQLDEKLACYFEGYKAVLLVELSNPFHLSIPIVYSRSYWRYMLWYWREIRQNSNAVAQICWNIQACGINLKLKHARTLTERQIRYLAVVNSREMLIRRRLQAQ